MLESYTGHTSSLDLRKKLLRNLSDSILWVPMEQFLTWRDSFKEQSMSARVLYIWINQLPTYAI